jgi:hypothetical protein
MSEELKEAIREEVRLLDKKVELLKLRIEEAGNTRRAEYLKVTGRELHQCARRLESAVDSEPGSNTRQGWLPIESAPKDVFVLVLREGDIAIMRYYKDHGGGAWGPSGHFPGSQPTHWMPLPDAPHKG